MNYKGYTAEVIFDEKAKVLYGRVLDVQDVITFQSESAAALEEEFRASVDEYLEYCAELGREPEKPYSGKIAVRTTPAQHAMIARAAHQLGMSMNSFIERAAYTDAARVVQAGESAQEQPSRSGMPRAQERQPSTAEAGAASVHG